MDIANLRKEERIAVELSLYFKSRGFEEYKMGAFEEYSMYMENRDFLLSKNMAVFAGQDGKLYALRPDVTLSIVKNARTDGGTKKFFYREMVCRPEKGSKSYREVSQIGAEVIGEIDRAAEAEIILLIMKTLCAVNENCLLDISHMGYVNGLVDAMGIEENKEELLRFLKDKNAHDFDKFAEQNAVSKDKAEVFKKVAALGGPAEKALEKAKALALNEEMASAAEDLSALLAVTGELGLLDKINLNFSIANNADYYNGIIYNGYVAGVPKAVLGGGRYDKLAQKFGKKAQAIGFALYLGELSSYFGRNEEKIDVLLLYRDGQEAAALKRAEELNAAGKSVKISRSADGENYKTTEDIR
ncbi:MAG: hypothetical protein DBX59_10210 [Bacillota bacterium]|nr:MAG: hypothetical protein DBX59_10210 [Bacillota bacterium]